jgi:hypothetical protein
MAILELTLKPLLPHYDLTTTLDGVSYTLEFRWNTRDSSWFMSIRLEDGTDVVNGVKVVVGYPLGFRSRHASRPPGMFQALDTSGKKQDPGINDLGARVRLYYFDLAEVNAVRSDLGLAEG